MGSKPKKPGQSPEELALARAQVLQLSRDEAAINERKGRIIRSQYATRASVLRGSGKSQVASGAPSLGPQRGGSPKPPR